MESVLTIRNGKLRREWIDGAKKRIGIAHQTRLSNPRLSVDILLEVVGELLKRLPAD